eukprot:Clim_evm1s83 gene=Clim_evmTU1s83
MGLFAKKSKSTKCCGKVDQKELDRRLWTMSNSPSQDIDFAGMNLREVPDQLVGICMSKSQFDLSLDYNALKELPNGLAKAVGMRVLSVMNNGLKYLPTIVPNWSNLQEMVLSNNKLCSLPEWIGHACPNLRVLNVSGNRLTTLPDSIGDLQELRTLDANNNNIRVLPPSLGHLVNCSLMDLTENPICKLLPSDHSATSAESIRSYAEECAQSGKRKLDMRRGSSASSVDVSTASTISNYSTHCPFEMLSMKPAAHCQFMGKRCKELDRAQMLKLREEKIAESVVSRQQMQSVCRKNGVNYLKQSEEKTMKHVKSVNNDVASERSRKEAEAAKREYDQTAMGEKAATLTADCRAVMHDAAYSVLDRDNELAPHIMKVMDQAFTDRVAGGALFEKMLSDEQSLRKHIETEQERSRIAREAELEMTKNITLQIQGAMEEQVRKAMNDRDQAMHANLEQQREFTGIVAKKVQEQIATHRRRQEELFKDTYELECKIKALGLDKYEMQSRLAADIHQTQLRIAELNRQHHASRNTGGVQAATAVDNELNKLADRLKELMQYKHSVLLEADEKIRKHEREAGQSFLSKWGHERRQSQAHMEWDPDRDDLEMLLASCGKDMYIEMLRYKNITLSDLQVKDKCKAKDLLIKAEVMSAEDRCVILRAANEWAKIKEGINQTVWEETEQEIVEMAGSMSLDDSNGVSPVNSGLMVSKAASALADEEALCKMCNTYEVSVINVPCGHTSLCHQCSLNTLYCPVCHEECISTVPLN